MSCHWTTPQRRLHPRTRQLESRTFRRVPACKSSLIERLCKHARTLSGRVRTTRRRIGALVSAALALLLGACAPVVTAAKAVVARTPSPPCPGANMLPASTNAAAIGAATVCLINQLRGLHHRHLLGANRYLQRVATGQVRQMVRWSYFADVRPSGQTPAALIASTGYAAHAARLATGENIGWGTGAETTPAAMVAGWMASPSHRALILARVFHDIGVGVSPRLPGNLRRGPLGALYAVEFGARAG